MSADVELRAMCRSLHRERDQQHEDVVLQMQTLRRREGRVFTKQAEAPPFWCGRSLHQQESARGHGWIACLQECAARRRAEVLEAAPRGGGAEADRSRREGTREQDAGAAGPAKARRR